MIGQTISHYRILKKLGEGGMGVVYKAEDLRLKRFVALKFLPNHLVKDKHAREMFINEAISASSLDHPSICTVHEILETPEGQHYIVMAYYQGFSLKKKIEQHSYEINDVMTYAIEIASGLAKAHSHGIVHRDIKPANILITDENQVKIIDFGLAKLVGEKQKIDEITSEGTTTYMSPEQLNGLPVDDRTDIWSLGVLIYELISGRYPFRGDYEQAIIYSILNEEPEDLRRLNRNMPVQLGQIIKKALQKDPAKRFQHMIEMRDELEKLRHELEISKGNKNTAETAGTFFRKYRYVFMALVSLMLIIVLFLFWPSAGKKKQNSVLILPLQDLNAQDSLSYFSDGLSEDILTQCSKISGLRVLSWKTSIFYKNRVQTLESLGYQDNVSHILEGTVRRQKDQIRIAVQLKTIASGEVAWAETYQRKISDVFRIQSDVARSIAQTLQVRLKPGDLERLNHTYEANLPAYEAYMKGRDYYYRYNETSNDQAIRLFRRSLQEDKNYALAHAGLADAFAQRTMRFGQSPEWLDSAYAHCTNALDLDPGLAEAYKALGVVYYTRSKFRESLKANLEALERNPNHAPAMGNLGWTYLNTGDLKSAKHWLYEANSRTLINPTISFGLGLLHLNLDQPDIAERWFKITNDLQSDYKPHPGAGIAMIDLLRNQPDIALEKLQQFLKLVKTDAALYIAAGDVSIFTGNPLRAAEYYQAALNLDPSSWNPLTGINATTSLGFIFWKTGHQVEAQQMFDLSEELNRSKDAGQGEWWGDVYDLAAIQAIKGDTQQSIQLLHTAAERGFRLYKWLQIDPLFELLRADENFNGLLDDLSKKIPKEDQN